MAPKVGSENFVKFCQNDLFLNGQNGGSEKLGWRQPPGGGGLKFFGVNDQSLRSVYFE